MFLTVGQKLKKYRKLFNIKLSMFERYGFSAAYISYIENNKRIPPFETAKEIFEALVCLTNGEIVKQITVEDFVKDEYEEAESWVIVNCNLDMALNNYKQYYEACNKYNLNNYLIKLDEILAYYYQSIKKYFISNEYFTNCISQLKEIDKRIVKYYIELGVNYQDLGLYEESLLNLNLALKCIKTQDLEYIYRIYYELSRSYYYLKKLDDSYLLVDKIIDNCPFIQRKAAAILLKENILKVDGRLEEGEKILKQFIEKQLYTPYLKYAYHNLGCNLNDQHKYREALEVLNQALAYRTSSSEIALTNYLIGEVYYNMKDLTNSRKYYSLSQEMVLKEGTFDHKKTVVERLISLYFDLGDMYSIEQELQLIDLISHECHYRELKNIAKINILRCSVSNGVNLTPKLRDYVIGN